MTNSNEDAGGGLDEERPPRPLRRFLVRSGIGLGAIAGVVALLIFRYGPWVKACARMNDIATNPVRMDILNAAPETWEPEETTDARVSVGFASFCLPGPEHFMAELNGAHFSLVDGKTQIMLMPPFETTSPAASSSMAEQQLEAIHIGFKPDGEMFWLSRAGVEHYMQLVELKAYDSFNIEGVAMVATPTALVLLHLGETRSPNTIRALAMSKDSARCSYLYIASESAEKTRALAKEIASTIRYSGESISSGRKYREAALKALAEWLPADSIHELDMGPRSGPPEPQK